MLVGGAGVVRLAAVADEAHAQREDGFAGGQHGEVVLGAPGHVVAAPDAVEVGRVGLQLREDHRVDARAAVLEGVGVVVDLVVGRRLVAWERGAMERE